MRFSQKMHYFRIALYSDFQSIEFLCEEVFWEKFDYNASPYFRVETVDTKWNFGLPTDSFWLVSFFLLLSMKKLKWNCVWTRREERGRKIEFRNSIHQFLCRNLYGRFYKSQIGGQKSWKFGCLKWTTLYKKEETVFFDILCPFVNFEFSMWLSLGIMGGFLQKFDSNALFLIFYCDVSSKRMAFESNPLFFAWQTFQSLKKSETI